MTATAGTWRGLRLALERMIEAKALEIQGRLDRSYLKWYGEGYQDGRADAKAQALGDRRE